MRRLPPVLAPVLAAAALLAAAVPAVATPPVGADVSAPQAGAPLPADAAFGIVGVNGGTFADLNPDFARQWQQWAVARPGGPPQVYVLSANPGSAGASWGQPGPSNACDGSSGDPDCASDYGFNGAQRALAAATGVVTRPVTWWVDIEGGTDGPTWDPTRLDLNADVLRGELAGLLSRPDLVARVGMYTRMGTPGQVSEFASIMGTTAEFAHLPGWVATGQTTAAGAAHVGCGRPAPSGGPVVQAQAVPPPGGTDTDAACPPTVTLAAPALAAPARAVVGPSGRTVPVAGTGLPGSRLSLAITDLRATHPRLTRTVTVGAAGTWSTGLPLAVDGRLSLRGEDGQQGSADVRPAVVVVITGHPDAAAACRSTVVGTTAGWWPGERVQLQVAGHRVADGPVRKAGSGGSWSVPLAATCGAGQRVSAYIDGKDAAGRTVTEPGRSRVVVVRRS